MVKPPTPEELREISASYNLDLSDADVDLYLGFEETGIYTARPESVKSAV